ncbi:MAG: helix-turn-helix transcriptional regulator [Lachnospiraceae bacterium]|nr:helix-turn-helix transcriptional regulator [Lachnospiraceae bacterium]
MDENIINFGRNLSILRNTKGISQQEMADELHVTRQTISVWERNQGKPDIYALHAVCAYFGVSVEKMMYGRMIDTEERYEAFEMEERVYESRIRSICKKGLYVINDEDLEEFFDIIDYGFERIMTIAVVLKKRGYIVTEVFDNGFSICFRNDEEASGFPKALEWILDSLVHHDDPYIEEIEQEISTPYRQAEYEIIMQVSAMLHGKNIYDFKYYWVDDMQNPRGYADTKEECEKQAMEQSCEDYYIIPIAEEK